MNVDVHILRPNRAILNSLVLGIWYWVFGIWNWVLGIGYLELGIDVFWNSRPYYIVYWLNG